MVKVVTKTSVAQTAVQLVKAGTTGVNLVFTSVPGNLYIGGSDLSETGGVVSNGVPVNSTPLALQLSANEQVYCLILSGTQDVSVLTTFGSVV